MLGSPPRMLVSAQFPETGTPLADSYQPAEPAAELLSAARCAHTISRLDDVNVQRSGELATCGPALAGCETIPRPAAARDQLPKEDT